MIVIMKDGEDRLAEVTLAKGKLAVKNLVDGRDVNGMIDDLRSLHGYPLTDGEVYRMMPFRMNGRISAEPEGADEKMLEDPTVYKAIEKRLEDKMRRAEGTL